MSAIRDGISEYLSLRRSLGYKLEAHGAQLWRFAAFLEEHGALSITTDLALRWATQMAGASPSYWAHRLSAARSFARFYSATDPMTEIPGLDLLRHCGCRRPPYIYTDGEILDLLEKARAIPSRRGLQGQTCATALGLLVVTGMRVGELVGLDQADVDFSKGVLTIRQAKFGKSRLVLIHSSTQAVLQEYEMFRDKVLPQPDTTAFFRCEHGGRLSTNTLRQLFLGVSRQIGLRGAFDPKGPRLHDFRHRFAVTTLLAWYRAGMDVEQQLPTLSTYLGHVNVTSTYWYLSAIPELMGIVVERLDGGGLGR